MQKRAKGHKYQISYESNKHNGNRDKTRTKKKAPWFLSKAGSPKGKMQPQEEGFGLTKALFLCLHSHSGTGASFGFHPKEAPMPEPESSSESMENVWNISCI